MKKYPHIAVILSVAVVLGMPFNSHAVKAMPGLITVTQPDGTKMEVRLVGDERFHYYISEDGYPLINDNDAYYYAKVAPDGSLSRSPMTAQPAAARSVAAVEFLAGVDCEMTLKAIPRRESAPAMALPEAMSGSLPEGTTRYGLFPGATFPTRGQQKALVILVEYSDVGFITDDAGNRFTRMLNENGYNLDGATGSARDYFVDCSAGQFIPDFDVYGPVTLSQPMSYYGGNDNWGNDKHPHHMVTEACALLDDEIDFTQYDRDDDGVIDNVFVFYAGRGEATNGGANTVWPHSAKITEMEPEENYVFDGVLLDSYACTNEWVSGHTCGIGTFCHEFSHVLGLPDLYATTYTSSFTPGAWSLLDSGSYNNEENTPAGYSIFERYALGWIDPVVIGDISEKFTLMPVSDNEGAIIPTGKDNEFFLIENRQMTGWDSHIPGHGMLVWHIDYLERPWRDNTVNNKPRHQHVDIEEADKKPTELTRAGDAFPGTAGITEISGETSPALLPWDNTPLGIAITGITETLSGTITFDVVKKSDSNASLRHITTGGSTVTVDGCRITVKSPCSTDVAVITASGITVASGRGTHLDFTVATPGIYIVTAGGETIKTTVR